MSKILMISLKTLKDNYLVDNNLEDKYLLSNIQKGMDFVVKPIIGSESYGSILAEIEDNSLSESNKSLLNQIEPILAYFVMSETVYSTAYKLKNKGLEEGSDSGRFDELVRISKKYLLDSQHYQQLLQRTVDISCKDKKKNIYKSGLYLG